VRIFWKCQSNQKIHENERELTGNNLQMRRKRRKNSRLEGRDLRAKIRKEAEEEETSDILKIKYICLTCVISQFLFAMKVRVQAYTFSKNHLLSLSDLCCCSIANNIGRITINSLSDLPDNLKNNILRLCSYNPTLSTNFQPFLTSEGTHLNLSNLTLSSNLAPEHCQSLTNVLFPYSSRIQLSSGEKNEFERMLWNFQKETLHHLFYNPSVGRIAVGIYRNIK